MEARDGDAPRLGAAVGYCPLWRASEAPQSKDKLYCAPSGRVAPPRNSLCLRCARASKGTAVRRAAFSSCEVHAA